MTYQTVQYGHNRKMKKLKKKLTCQTVQYVVV